MKNHCLLFVILLFPCLSFANEQDNLKVQEGIYENAEYKYRINIIKRGIALSVESVNDREKFTPNEHGIYNNARGVRTLIPRSEGVVEIVTNNNNGVRFVKIAPLTDSVEEILAVEPHLLKGRWTNRELRKSIDLVVLDNQIKIRENKNYAWQIFINTGNAANQFIDFSGNMIVVRSRNELLWKSLSGEEVAFTKIKR